MTTSQSTKVDQNIVDKINKLLALSTSPNEHESAAAAAKVSTLLAQYNLSLSDLGGISDEDFGEYVVESSKIMVTWKMTLLQGIAHVNGCTSFYTNCKNIMLVGYPASCVIVHNLYNYLSQTIERLAAEHKGKGRSFLNAFKVGCATRLLERLAEKRKEMESVGIPGDKDSAPTSAIVVKSMFQKTDMLAKAYFASKRMRTVQAKFGDTNGYNSGYDSANQIGLNDQLKNQRPTKQLAGI